MTAAGLVALWHQGQPSPWALVLGFAVAVGFDALVGELPNRLHPVVAMGSAVQRLKPWVLRGGPVRQLLSGTLLTFSVVLLSAASAWLSVFLCPAVFVLEVAVCSYWIVSAFALKGLTDAASAMGSALAAGDLAAARFALRSLCSRDPESLSASQLTAGTLESLSENTSDSVVAPLLWLVVFGLPGMLAYRAANTLDAMIGYRGDLEYAGKGAARLDDVLNWVPARLTAGLLLLAAALLGRPLRRGVRVTLRDAAKTSSPNAGYPMAAFAGILGVELEKPGHYVLGGEFAPPGPGHLSGGIQLVRVSGVLCFGLAAVGLVLGAR